MTVLHGSAHVVALAATPEDAYALVADVTRTPEWSPEVVACRWIGGAMAARPGARFKGTSRSRALRWTRTCEVLTANPGAEFSFRTLRDLINRDSTTWRYTFEGVLEGTRITESFEVHEEPGLLVRVLAALFADRPEDMTPHVQSSLAGIKFLLEEGRMRA